MAEVFIGIDPGLDGALAVIDGTAVLLHDTPVGEVGKQGGKRRVYLEALMADLLRPYAGRPVRVMLERSQAMGARVQGRTQGVSSSFSIGEGYGLWRGILAGLGMTWETVPPATWKKALLGVQGSEKDASRVLAIRMFPATADQLKLKRHHGRAEALLLAEWGRRKVG
jgi:hypothetical protein